MMLNISDSVSLLPADNGSSLGQVQVHYSHSASLHQVVWILTCELNAEGSSAMD